MKKPMPEMTHKPYGEDYMFDAWLGLVTTTFNEKELRDKFMIETGVNIYDIVTAKGINEMIDKSTGRQKEAVVRWLDWVTVTLWGVESNL